MKPKRPASTTKAKRVLIVDDDPGLRNMLTLLLKEAGYEAMGAEHALAAVFAAVRARPDLVLIDLRMPIMNGLELIRELKTHNDTRGIRVVAMTGFENSDTRAAAIEAGCDGFLAKPFEPNSLLDKIAEWVK